MGKVWSAGIAIALAAGCFQGDFAKPGTCAVGEMRACVCSAGLPGWETCNTAEPAIWGQCLCNAAPIANAGPDQHVSYKTVVELDGSGSHDSDGSALRYHWAVVAIPQGSVATLDDPGAVAPHFQADLVGTYTFTLTVEDAVQPSHADTVEITVVDDAPIATTNPHLFTVTGAAVSLDGSASSDPNSDPITYAWTVFGRPNGSVATPAAPSAAVTAFTPDVDGDYALSLQVDDGMRTSMPKTVQITSYRPIAPLPFEPIDAGYSRPLDRIVMIADRLYIYDPDTATSVPVTLPAPPLALSISPDGLTAAVGHGGALSLVDLQTATVLRTYPVAAVAFAVTLAGNGYAYVFPADTSLTRAQVHCIRLADGVETENTGSPIFANTRGALVPGAEAIYAAPTGIDLLAKLTIAAGTGAYDTGADFINENVLCGRIWASVDEQVLVTGCGDVLHASPDPMIDMTVIGSLNVMLLRSVATTTDTLMMISEAPFGNPTAEEGFVRRYDLPSFALRPSVALPSFVVAGAPVPALGRFVFVGANRFHAIVQLDPQATVPDKPGVVSYGL